MGMDLGSGKGVKSDINVTPLVDVVLVLLIIFMVITPMLQKGVNVDLPEARHVASRETRPGQEAKEPLVLAVKADGTYWLDDDELATDEIAQRVEIAYRSEPGRPLLVKGDKAVEFGQVRTLIKALEDAGIQGASLAAAELKDEGAPEGSEGE